MSISVKICGITRIEDAQTAARAGADFIGLIRAESPRQVTLATAIEIAAAVCAVIRPVLLYRNATIEQICDEAQAASTSWIQLHGCESIAFLSDLRASMKTMPAIIRAWPVSNEADGDALRQYLGDAQKQGVAIEAVILDAPKDANAPPLSMLESVAREAMDCAVPLWCAGGLTPDTVATAAALPVFAGVDAARGVESSPGVKDQEAIRRFVENARRAVRRS